MEKNIFLAFKDKDFPGLLKAKLYFVFFFLLKLVSASNYTYTVLNYFDFVLLLQDSNQDSEEAGKEKDHV